MDRTEFFEGIDLDERIKGDPEIHDIVGTELPIMEFDFNDPTVDFDVVRKTMQYGNTVGGSEAANIMGVSQYGGAFSSYSQKMGLSPVPDISDKDPVKLGKLYEDIVRQEAELFLGGDNPDDVHIYKPNEMYRHPVHNWMTASLDGIIHDRKSPYDRGLCEIKTTDSYQRLSQVRKGIIPEDWLMQMHHYACFRIPEGYPGAGLPFTYVSLVVKQSVTKPCIVVTQPVDWDLCRRIIEAEREFVQRLETSDPPAPNGTEGDTEALKSLPMGEGVIEADDSYRDLHEAAKHAKKMREEYASEHQECVNMIRKKMSDQNVNKVLGIASMQTRKGMNNTMLKDKLRVHGLVHLMDECKVEGKPFIKLT